MATRVLPGVYTSLNDISQIPEGPTSLIVGYVLAAEKGEVNVPKLVTSPADFLAKYAYLGKPGIDADPTYWDILKVLPQTNQMYVIRAAKNPRYGALAILKENILGEVIAIDVNDEAIVITVDSEDANAPEGTRLQLEDSRVESIDLNGYYDVNGVEHHDGITVFRCNRPSYVAFRGHVQYKCDVTAITDTIEDVYAEDPEHIYAINVRGDLTGRLDKEYNFLLRGCSVEKNNHEFHVREIRYDENIDETWIRVWEEVFDADDGFIWHPDPTLMVAPQQSTGGLAPDEGWEFHDNTCFLVTGKDPGEYNNHIQIGIVSSIDRPQEFVYYKGAEIGSDEYCNFDTMTLNVYDEESNSLLESFTFSKDRNAKTIDGQSLYIDDVVKGSNFIRIINNEEITDLPSTSFGRINLNGGQTGDFPDESTLVAALNGFADKTVPVSILACGSSYQQESRTYQQALLEIATTRKDVVVFLNSRKEDEVHSLPSERVEAMVDYKKGELGAVTFYGTMYSPHVNTTDTINQRQVKIGAASTAVAGWLNVINSLSYPYAYAGPQNGQVLGVTCDWKIGDTSGEAQYLNNASINYIAFDAKVGRYYMQCQNTLQIANSSMRNLGAVMNVLDIKEHFQTSLKEYVELPITKGLRRDIMNTAKDYLDPMTGVRFYNYTFQDVSTDLDIADNTLRYLLTLNPTAYAQKIYLIMNIVNANFDFSILQSM